MPQKPKKAQPTEETPLVLTKGWGQQLLGAVIGALAMGVVTQIGASLGWEPANRTALLFIGAAAGAVLFDLDRFALAGSRLTRRTEGRGIRLLNILIALLGMAIVGGLVIALTSLIGQLLDFFS
ncbi:MAG TPA: hypothetical protein PLJ78_02790 [Anaerolineae bacterium]|nr:hypothetical protein [Anaerolineae bacterium]HQK12853.1 hypothetical protein [Anaerolineae bacterium]